MTEQELFEYFQKIDHLCRINNTHEIDQLFIKEIENFSPDNLHPPITLLSSTYLTRDRYRYREDLLKHMEGKVDPKVIQGL